MNKIYIKHATLAQRAAPRLKAALEAMEPMNKPTDNKPMTHVQAVHDQQAITAELRKVQLQLNSQLNNQINRAIKAEAQRDAAVAALKACAVALLWMDDKSSGQVAALNQARAAIAAIEGNAQ